MENIGTYSIAIIITCAAFAVLFSSKDCFSAMLKGTREGFVTSVKILPSLILLICATRMLAASGALEYLCTLLSCIAKPLGIPTEIIPLIIIRPVSGSAATAMADTLFSSYGPDSFAGRCASVLMGSSDTIIYTLSMYFGACGIKHTRHALTASFLVLGFCVILSVLLTRLFWA